MEIHFFIVHLEIEANRVASAKTTQMMHNDSSDVFTGIDCFKHTFSLQIKDAKPSSGAAQACIIYCTITIKKGQNYKNNRYWFHYR